jgi:hypothetical protein
VVEQLPALGLAEDLGGLLAFVHDAKAMPGSKSIPGDAAR